MSKPDLSAPWELMRLSADALRAHATSVRWDVGNVPLGFRCAICEVENASVRTALVHSDDCLVTRLRLTADKLERLEADGDDGPDDTQPTGWLPL